MSGVGGAAGEVGERGQEIDVARGQGRAARREPGHADDHRHLRLRRVQVIAVQLDAVLAEALAVVAGHDHDGLVVQARARSSSSSRPMW